MIVELEKEKPLTETGKLAIDSYKAKLHKELFDLYFSLKERNMLK